MFSAFRALDAEIPAVISSLLGFAASGKKATASFPAFLFFERNILFHFFSRQIMD